jgi:hypothetical protein
MTKGESQYPQWGVQLVSLVKYSKMLRVESPHFKKQRWKILKKNLKKTRF